MTVLATLSGLSQQSISYIEREKRIPNLDTLLRIAEALKVDLGTIIKDASASIKSPRTK